MILGRLLFAALLWAGTGRAETPLRRDPLRVSFDACLAGEAAEIRRLLRIEVGERLAAGADEMRVSVRCVPSGVTIDVSSPEGRELSRRQLELDAA